MGTNDVKSTEPLTARGQLLNTDGFAQDILEQIEKLLAEELLGNKSLEKIKERYAKIKGGNCFLEDFIPMGKKSPFKDLRKDPNNVIGLDFPVWFGVKSKNRPIMIVCQDSGRDTGVHIGREEVIVNTLFGVHNTKWRNSKYGKPFAEMVEALMKAGYPVYVTDSVKFFVAQYDESKGNGKNKELDKKKRGRYLEILKKEISIVNPCALIAMGGCAWEMIGKEQLEVELKSKIEHISYRFGKNNTEENGSRGEISARKILDFLKNKQN